MKNDVARKRGLEARLAQAAQVFFPPIAAEMHQQKPCHPKSDPSGHGHEQGPQTGQKPAGKPLCNEVGAIA